jgi:hypothetical protein
MQHVRGRKRPRTIVVLKTLNITCFLVGLIVLAGCDRPTSATSPNRAAVEGAAVHFRLLRSPSDGMPLIVRRHLSHILSGQLDGPLEPMAVHSAQTAHGTVWVFLADHALCLAHAGRGAVGCSAVSRVGSDGVSLGVFSPPSKQFPRPHDFLLISLVPDGIQQIGVTIGGRSRTVKVEHNLASVSSDQPIQAKSWARPRD